jgi:outer membrane protein OmpA-like peptidoglycan-associated protein
MKNRSLALALCVALLLPACDQDVLDKVNPNGGTPESYYKNADELTKGVNSIYAVLQGSNLAGREWYFLNDLRSDDVASGGGQLETPRNQILTGSHTASNPVMGSVWNGLYRTILRANTVTDNAPKAENIDEDLRSRLVGEAQFLRAWAYYNLVSLWGGVPLYKTVSQSLVDLQPRATAEEIYQFIEEDLKVAQEGLPLSYGADEKGRATKGAAQALLGKVYAQQGKYDLAKAELEKVKNSGVYKLESNYLNNFLEETPFNAESVFEIGFQGTNFNWESDGNGTGNEGNTRTQEYSAIGWRNLIPSDPLLADFEMKYNGSPKDDPRFRYSFYRIGDTINGGKDVLLDTQVQGNLSNFAGGKEKISWRKYTSTYKNKETFYTGGMNMRVIRYADVLLLLAECENELGNIPAAIGYLNEVRSRPSVAMPPYPTAQYPANSKAEVFRAVAHERRVELAGEQIRNFDILRWRKQNKLTTEPISYFAPNKFELLPIPQDELSNNAKLSQADQNPGY